MPDLTEFQLEVISLFFSLPASKGFLLAGGAALLAQHLPGPHWLPRNSPGASCSRYSIEPRHGTSPTYEYSPGVSARMFSWPAPHRSTRALISGPWLA